MNGGRASGWQRIGAAFWGLGAVLLLAGVAAASEAAHGGGHGGISAEKMQDLLWRTVNFVVFAAFEVTCNVLIACPDASEPPENSKFTNCRCTSVHESQIIPPHCPAPSW